MVIPEKGFNKCAGFQVGSVSMQETWVPCLGQEDPLEWEMATCSVFLPGKSHGQRSLADYSLWDR